MVIISRGDIVLCDLNPVVGSEQAGIRPVLVLQIDRANAVSPHTIIAPFTTKIRQVLLPSHVFVAAGEGGLDQDSILLCEQIRVIDKRRIVNVLGQLSVESLQQVEDAVRVILGLKLSDAEEVGHLARGRGRAFRPEVILRPFLITFSSNHIQIELDLGRPAPCVRATPCCSGWESSTVPLACHRFPAFP